MRRESRRTRLRFGLRVGRDIAFRAPVVGLLVFPLVSFKPVVTLYALIVGLALVLRHMVEPARLALEAQGTVRRHSYGHHAP